MGPSRLFHKNKSQHSLSITHDTSGKRSYQPSPLDSPLHSPGFAPARPPPEYDDDDADRYSLPYRSTPQQDHAQYYQQTRSIHHPTRSQSQRSPVSINTNTPTISFVRATQGPASTPTSAIEAASELDRSHEQRGDPAHPTSKEKGAKRRFFGLGSSKEPTAAPTNRLGRSRSVRGKEQYPEQSGESSIHSQHIKHHHWSRSRVSPTEDDEEVEDAEGSVLRPLYSQHAAASSTSIEKDPLRSPAFPPPISHQEYAQGKASQQPSSRSPGDWHASHRQDLGLSTWDRTADRLQHSGPQNIGQHQAPSSYHQSPSSATSASSHHFQQRPPPDSLREHWPEQDSRPSSRQSADLALPTGQHPYGHHSKNSPSQASSTSYIQGSMGPPLSTSQHSGRRSAEFQQAGQTGQSREASEYRPYTQSLQGQNGAASNLPPQYSTQLAPQRETYRNQGQPSPMQQLNNNDQGRSTSPPSRSRDDLSSPEYAQLHARHDELQDKYRKVKKYYFDKDAQVTQLQNALAHQRLSLSRTSLDDNEYANRFSRLDGAINNLAFNIRRDWRIIPPWLAPHVNRDAATNPTKEMTAVGRAAISRWLLDELLDRYFHPAIEPTFSAQLKIVEKNIRRFAAPTPSDEEKDALLGKISNWRLSTLDGLADSLTSPQASEYRATLTASLINQLTTALTNLLKDPAPPGLEGGVSMIIELAIGIAANLPLESRDVFVNYVAPGMLVNDHYMKIESGLPPLINPGEGAIEGVGEGASMASSTKQTEDTGSIDSRDTGNNNPGGNGDGGSDAPSSGLQSSPQQQQQQQQQQGSQKQDKKKSMFGSIMSAGSSTLSNNSSKKPPTLPQQQSGGPQAGDGKREDRDRELRVRFSTFMAVEVRGRSVLVKAPVYVRD